MKSVLLGLGIAAGGIIAYPFFKQSPKTSSVVSVDPLVTLQDRKVPVPVKLIDRKSITHDTDLFRFALPSPEHTLGLPTGQHVHLQTMFKNSKLDRIYTPVSSNEQKGIMDMVIKLYRPNVHPKFPDGGKMSTVLDAMAVGDSIDIRGPTGKFFYQGKGRLGFKKSRNDSEPSVFHDVQKITMIAGGSGITPMLQLIRHVVKDPEDETKLELLFANKSEEDIILRDELEDLQRKHPDQLKVWYTVDKAPKGWKYSEGFISAKMLKEVISPPSNDTFVFLCGPKPMVKNACKPALQELGYDSNRVHKF